MEEIIAPVGGEFMSILCLACVNLDMPRKFGYASMIFMLLNSAEEYAYRIKIADTLCLQETNFLTEFA
jgi:hypothetical protein